MKNVLKVLLILVMSLSLMACSNDNWEKELDGTTAAYKITYNNKSRKIVVQVDNEHEMKFYYNKELYCTLKLDFGYIKEDEVFDSISFKDDTQDGYDDIYFSFYDDYDHHIRAEFIYEPYFDGYYLQSFDSLAGAPASEYVGFWELDGNADNGQILINALGTWSTLDGTGSVEQRGYVYKNEKGYDLYDDTGAYRGKVEIADSYLFVTIDEKTQHYTYSY